jgi:hypothetical protein
MKFARLLSVFLLVLIPSVPVFGQPTTAGGPPKLFHHHAKKNPHQSSVHHAKPAHHATKHEKPNR